jgi:hypothetical protein
LGGFFFDLKSNFTRYSSHQILLSPGFLPSFQYRTIEAERLNFIEVKEKTSRKYNKLLKILEKEKTDLQYQLDSEQKGIHARRDSDVSGTRKSEAELSTFCAHTKSPEKSLQWTRFIALFFTILRLQLSLFLSHSLSFSLLDTQNAGTNKNIKFNGQEGEDSPGTHGEEKHFGGIGSSGSKGSPSRLFILVLCSCLLRE